MTEESDLYTESGDHYAPTEAYLRSRLQTMDPDTFEHFIADVWEQLGWYTRVVGEPGDKGIDVIAAREGQKQLVQAKRYGPNTTVGSPEVQQYASLRLQEDGVDTVTIVTTGEFSRQAEDMAPDLGVTLVDGEDLLGILDDFDGWGVVADYFDELKLREDVEAADRDDDRGDDAGGWVDRVREWVP
ncbi:restriction endonuclease [Haloarcula laminariae]|uniref:restriction endonuclease n=1 Tax=Haloarcula laminariae TaxID=2961577 RepID=UPI002404B4AA|nr:restriction endonuclease [Halomicroarcula sp. FL173]